MHPDTASRFVDIARQLATPPFSHRTDAMLATCLRPLSVSVWPEVAWQSSRLTRDGCPVEFAFCGHDAALRMTVEPATAEIPEPTKLERASRLLEAMGFLRPERGLIAQWHQSQARHTLRWGAWLGLRQTVSGLRAKLYVEMPSTSSPPHASPGQLRMIGHEQETERSEFYYSLPASDALQLSYLLTRYGIPEPRSVLERLADLAGLPLTTALRWLRLGMSIAKDRNGQIAGVALFFRASAAHGGQARIRDALLQQQDAKGVRNSTYRTLFANVDVSGLPDHGVVTLNLSPDGDTSIGVGISGAALLNRWNAIGDSQQAA